MARGWESKSVEQQQAESADERQRGPSLSARQKEQKRKRDGLLLSRTALARQLETSPHPQRRSMLEKSLAEIDRQLAALQENTVPFPADRNGKIP
jgi:protein-arginine kinase